MPSSTGKGFLFPNYATTQAVFSDWGKHLITISRRNTRRLHQLRKASYFHPAQQHKLSSVTGENISLLRNRFHRLGKSAIFRPAQQHMTHSSTVKSARD